MGSMPRRTSRENFDGREFNSVRILGDAPDYELARKDGKIKRFRSVFCMCLLCGNDFPGPVLLSNIKRGNTKSCGCRETERKKATLIPVKTGRVANSFLEVVKEVGPVYLPGGRPIRQVEVRCHGPCRQPEITLLRNWESVRNLKTISCGCHQKRRAVEANLRNYSGETSGHLEAVRRISHVAGQGNAIWLCRCSCGRHKNQDMGKWGRSLSCGKCGLTGGRDSYQYFVDNPDWATSSCALYIVEVNHGECFKIGIAKNLAARAGVSKSCGMEYTARLRVVNSIERATAWTVEQYILALTSASGDKDLVDRYKFAAGRYELRSSADKVMAAVSRVSEYIDECRSMSWIAYYQLKLDKNLSFANIENISSFRLIAGISTP